MLNVTPFQPCIYSIVNRIKIFWYNLLFFLPLFQLPHTDPYNVNRIMTKGMIRDICCKPSGELKIVFLFCGEVLLRVSSVNSLQFLIHLFLGDSEASLEANSLYIC